MSAARKPTNKLGAVMLEGLVVGRPVYALCTYKESTRKIKAKYYAMVVEGGPHPLWAIWQMGGKFHRFFVKRITVEEAFPQLVWRRMSAKLMLAVPVVDQSYEDEMNQIVEHYDALKRSKSKKANVIKLKA